MKALEAGKKYTARNGKTIEIFDINENTSITFRARGYILRVDTLGRTYRKFNIWMLNGSYRAFGEHALDIIGESK